MDILQTCFRLMEEGLEHRLHELGYSAFLEVQDIEGDAIDSCFRSSRARAT
jgi:hypothetical protein